MRFMRGSRKYFPRGGGSYGYCQRGVHVRWILLCKSSRPPYSYTSICQVALSLMTLVTRFQKIACRYWQLQYFHWYRYVAFWFNPLVLQKFHLGDTILSFNGWFQATLTFIFVSIYWFMCDPIVKISTYSKRTLNCFIGATHLLRRNWKKLNRVLWCFFSK